MAAVTAAVIGATVAAGSLAYTISNSEQQKRLAGQAQDRANQDSKNATNAANAEQATSDATDERNTELSNLRRRTLNPASAGGTGPLGSGSTTASGTTPASTVTPGTGTLLGT